MKSKQELSELVKILQSSPSYIKAYEDENFMQGDDARALRLLSEFEKTDIILDQEKIRSTIIVFGSARILSPEAAEDQFKEAEAELKKNPTLLSAQENLKKAEEKVALSIYYQQAQAFARLVSEHNQIFEGDGNVNHYDYVICTGGGPGIMEAANRGAYEVGAKTLGLNISLPFEQRPNPYITPNLCFQYHYFAIRKLHFMLRAKALVVFPGGFGTFDELFEGLTLRQTLRMQNLPIIMFGKDFWTQTIHFDHLVQTGMISAKDLELFSFVETPQEAWDKIRDFYLLHNELR